MASRRQGQMTDMERAVERASGLASKIGGDLEHFGGYLRCRTCEHELPMRRGDTGFYLGVGWPKCCGYTMEWITDGQIERGERPGPTRL